MMPRDISARLIESKQKKPLKFACDSKTFTENQQKGCTEFCTTDLPAPNCRQLDSSAVLGGNAFREEWDFVRALSDRSPFSAGLADELAQEITGMEFCTHEAQIPSIALAWATLLDSATVSFGAHPDWSLAWVDTSYKMLDDEGNLIEVDGKIRNASKVTHADEHTEWLKPLGLATAQPQPKYGLRKRIVFPVYDSYLVLSMTSLHLMVAVFPSFRPLHHFRPLHKMLRIEEEHSLARIFYQGQSESSQRQDLCWVHDNATGKKELFDWHIRFTGGFAGRIHFRVDTASRQIIVAYVGGKLTRKISGQ